MIAGALWSTSVLGASVMKIDLYSRVMLTVIAAALVSLVIENFVAPSVAQPGVSVTRVAICDINGERCASVGASATGSALVVMR
jgi:hypothetical protein